MSDNRTRISTRRSPVQNTQSTRTRRISTSEYKSKRKVKTIKPKVTNEIQPLFEPVLEADMTHWKYMWNDIISDPDFREWFLESDEYGYYQLFRLGKPNKSSVSKPKKEIDPKEDPLKKKGTFYLKFDGLGHYVAFENKKDAIYIFDSSHGENGRYADCLPPFIETIKKYFNPNIEFVEKFGTLQVLPGDSFCQTWSLSYLLGTKTQKIMMQATKQEKSQIEVLFELCKYIINLPVFQEICDKQAEWMKKAFAKNRNPQTPKKWTPAYFFNFSRERMDLESFHYLFK
jgi:hypothetical protein